MRARTPRRILGRAWAGIACAFLAGACEKVPLLAPTGSTITLTAQATALPINGTTDIIAQVLEQAGTPPHSGTVITFVTTLGSIEPAEARTDVAGRVIVKFRAGSSNGTATITATSGGATTGTDGSIKIAVGAAAVARIALSTNPGIVPAIGGTSTIVANVADINGNPLPSVAVSFATDAGSLSSSIATSDASGNAQTVLTTNKTAKVTATAGVSSSNGSSTTTQTATATVNVNTVAAITVGSPSPASPIVGQTVTFPVSQAAGGSAIQRTTVDWGDGTSSTFNGLPSSVSHAFSSIGSYAVRVAATDTFGDTATGGNSVTVNPRPQLTVTVSKTSPADPISLAAAGGAVVVTFSITATPTTGNVITGMGIDFGDGSTVNLAGNVSSAPHTYTATSPADGFKITVTATDSSGTAGAGSTIVIVRP